MYKNNSNRKRQLTFSEISKKFDIPLKSAARYFEMSEAVFKRQCRQMNIKKWPYKILKIQLKKMNPWDVKEYKARVLKYIKKSAENCNEFTCKYDFKSYNCLSFGNGFKHQFCNKFECKSVHFH